MPAITVKVAGGPERKCETGAPVGSFAGKNASREGLPFIAALVNNDLCSLSYPLSVNCEVQFLTMADSHGWRVYRKSLCFLLAMAVKQAYPEAVFSVEHSLGPGLYCTFRPGGGAEGAKKEEIENVAETMRELVRARLAIERHKISYADAVRQFRDSGQTDKLNLLKYRNPPRVVIHRCRDFSDLAHGPLAPGTGVLKLFELVPYSPGFVLHLPDRRQPEGLAPFNDQPHLFRIFQEHKEWGRILGVTTVGRLNEIIAEGGIGEFIRTAEALHEEKLAHIADAVAESSDSVKLVLVAGPSCAGKTTFAKRLGTHLAVKGLKTAAMSVDDYFVSRDETPKDSEGRPDFERIGAVDTKLLNEHLRTLAGGGEVEIPSFNFLTGQRERGKKSIRLEEGGTRLLIVEGIHALNPAVTERIPPETRYGVYISALTQLRVDSHNRLSTTDNRLMRRIVRDNVYRGHSALETLRMWPSVRAGEKAWIFPYQGEAHATFNSALDYELAVLKTLVEPLLMEIKPWDAEYAEARRLTEFLLNFLATGDKDVPGTSILREYIGGSSLEY
ncbi:MAG: nucleoside kinase [Kiritimatiellia bacterium]